MHFVYLCVDNFEANSARDVASLVRLVILWCLFECAMVHQCTSALPHYRHIYWNNPRKVLTGTRIFSNFVSKLSRKS